MNLSEIRLKTKSYLSSKWFSVASVLVIIALIEMVLGLIFRTNSIFTRVRAIYEAILYGGDVTSVIFATYVRGNIIGRLIMAFISSLLHAGFMMGLLKSVQEDRKLVFQDIVDSATEFMVPILIVSFASALVSIVLGWIPFLGAILNLIVGLMLSFALFIIEDRRTNDGLQALFISVDETKGYKLDLFLINIFYSIVPFAGYLLILVGLVFVKVAPILTGLFTLLGIIAFFVLSIIVLPYADVATVVVYERSKENALK